MTMKTKKMLRVETRFGGKDIADVLRDLYTEHQSMPKVAQAITDAGEDTNQSTVWFWLNLLQIPHQTLQMMPEPREVKEDAPHV